MQQFLLDRILNPIAKVYEDMSDRVRGIIFVAAMTLLLLYNVFKSLLVGAVPYLIVYVFGSICMGVAILALMKPNMKPISFRKIPLVLWLVGGVIIMVTSLVYNIDWISEGLLILVFCPAAFIVWGNVAHDRLLRLLSRACVTSFLVHVVFSALLVPMGDKLYGGLFNNVNGAGQYLVLVFSCLLVECMRSHQRKWVGYLCFVWLGICGALLFYTNSRTGMGSALAAFFVVVGMYVLRDWRKAKKEVTLRILGMILSVVLMLPVTIHVFHGSYQFSMWVREMTTSSAVSGTDVNQGGLGDFFEFAKLKTEINDKDIEAISTGRTAIWEAYLTNSDLFGNNVEESFFIESRHASYSTAHMVWITYAFRHGFICAGIWLVFTAISGLLALRYAWKRKGDPWAFLPLAISVVFGITALLASINTPYSYVLTMYYYFVQTLLLSKGFKRSKKHEEIVSQN